MDEPVDKSSEIKETDIVFDCPYCGKSLAIDYRGAGLTIPCTDCAKLVQVPIPEGMELSDIDSTDEEQEVRILNLRRSLSSAEYRIAQLEKEIEALKTRCEDLEKEKAQKMFRLGEVLEKTDLMQATVRTLTESIARVAEVVRTESQQQP